ncbi:MAG: RICIN domain-containing protein [Candidatus Symbiothrix sp.]|jgi:hypothetical protein|nr:RICIN domain-containing protein [Candidatus Symbiothrix sp.]
MQHIPQKIFCVLLLIITIPAKAQSLLPEVSTASNPIWYYIQVQGESERQDRVFTASGTQVLGQSMVMASNQTEIDKQLWRFEKTASGNYAIINKSTNKKLDIRYDSSKSISVGLLSDTPSTEWKLPKNSSYYNIQATKSPSGGATANVYAHQANNWDNRNYVIMFESTSYTSTANSLFHFVVYVDFTIEISTDAKPVWYVISSAKSGYENKYITEVESANNPNVNFALVDLDASNAAQQWKVVKKSSVVGDTRLQFVNKATGNIIHTYSVVDNAFHYVQSTTDLNASNGWTTHYIGTGQFEICGQETDGVTRYLNAAASTQTDPDLFLEEQSKNTAFAWAFKKADDAYSSLALAAPDAVRIYSRNHQIVVDGAVDYTVRNLQGLQFNRTSVLPLGIYLVTVNAATTKVVIK